MLHTIQYTKLASSFKLFVSSTYNVFIEGSNVWTNGIQIAFNQIREVSGQQNLIVSVTYLSTRAQESHCIRSPGSRASKSRLAPPSAQQCHRVEDQSLWKSGKENGWFKIMSAYLEFSTAVWPSCRKSTFQVFLCEVIIRSQSETAEIVKHELSFLISVYGLMLQK